MSFLGKLFKEVFGSATPPVATGDPARIAALEATLERLRPMLRADGGDVFLIAIDAEGNVRLEWVGACAHCAVQNDTLSQAIEPALRREHEWLREVRMQTQ